jgi:3-oxoacyl-[acyl-carrier protein] reductase
MKLENKVALITGAGSGFGAETARFFAREGAKVGVADIRADAAEQVAGEIGPAAVALAGDVSKADEVQAMVERLSQSFGDPDIVVNNAGFTHRNQPMLDVDEATFDKVFDVNVKSIFLMSHAVVPRMRAKGGGVIVNVGSTAGVRPRPGLTWYNASKGAVNLLSQSMAVELAGDGIRVNCIAPVMGNTAMLQDFMGVPDTPENRKKFLATIPMGRMSEPADVAKAALYLASDDSDFITGVVLPVDGGRCV